MAALGWLQNLGFAGGAAAVVIHPIGAVAAEVYFPGAQAAEVFLPGGQAAEVYLPGAQAAEVPSSQKANPSAGQSG